MLDQLQVVLAADLGVTLLGGLLHEDGDAQPVVAPLAPHRDRRAVRLLDRALQIEAAQVDDERPGLPRVLDGEERGGRPPRGLEGRGQEKQQPGGDDQP